MALSFGKSVSTSTWVWSLTAVCHGQASSRPRSTRCLPSWASSSSTPMVLQTLYVVCIRPVLEYGSLAWSGISRRDVDHARLQQSADHLIVGLQLVSKRALAGTSRVNSAFQPPFHWNDNIRISDHQTAAPSSEAHVVGAVTHGLLRCLIELPLSSAAATKPNLPQFVSPALVPNSQSLLILPFLS